MLRLGILLKIYVAWVLPRLASQLAWGIPCFCLLSAGISFPFLPRFMWVLEIWTHVVTLVWEALYTLSHLSSSSILYLSRISPQTRSLIIQLDRLASKPRASSCLYIPWDDRCRPLFPAFVWRWGVSILAFYACLVSILLILYLASGFYFCYISVYLSIQHSDYYSCDC